MNNMETPLYQHDCDYCKYLGRFEDKDLYLHDYSYYRTHLVRYSDEPSDYSSCPDYVLEKESNYPDPFMLECYYRARLVPTPLKQRFYKFMKRLSIHRTRANNKERVALLVEQLARLLDCFIYIFSLSYLSSNFGYKVVLSKWFLDSSDQE